MATSRAAYHHGNLSEAALTAAEDALDRAGADALTLRELAAQLGVSHRALYRHFADRDALLDALALRTMRALHAAMSAASAEHEAPRARIEAAIDAYVRFALRRPLAYGHAMRAGVARSGAPAPLREAARALGKDVSALYAAATKEVATSATCAEESMGLWGSVHGLVDLYLGGMLRAKSREHARMYILQQVVRRHLE